MDGEPTREDVLREAARPMEFFTHDVHAHEDIQLRRLVARCGMEGYGRWWLLCELLASADGHRISVEGMDGELWAAELRMAPDELGSFARELVRCGLCDLSGGWLSSHGMDSRAEKMGLQIASGKASGRKGGRPRKEAARGEKTPGVS